MTFCWKFERYTCRFFTISLNVCAMYNTIELLYSHLNLTEADGVGGGSGILEFQPAGTLNLALEQHQLQE